MNKDNKMAVAAIITAVLIIAALLAAILIIRKNSEPDGINTLPDDVLTAVHTEDVPVLSEDFDPEEIASSAGSMPERPSEWYGTYESSGPVEGGVDIAECEEVCPDVYAWISVPGTAIDYPIAYCEDAEDPFYFTHDMNGEPSEAGMIITDSQNVKDFSDPLTLIYGHSPDDGTMFTPLHAFKDADFFATHENVNIYMKDAELVYRIYACFTGSADNMLLTNDFNDPMGFIGFFDSMSSVRDLSMNMREDASPTFGDHVIALVTHCDDEDKRLFVYAVLEEVRY